jgi:hypothetical protein
MIRGNQLQKQGICFQGQLEEVLERRDYLDRKIILPWGINISIVFREIDRMN